MGRKMTTADEGIAPILALLSKNIKARHIKMQDISERLGKCRTWLSGVFARKSGMLLEDFLAVCRVAGIDPVVMLAGREEGGMIRYVKDVPIMDVVAAIVNARLAELLEGQDVMVRVPRAKKKDEPEVDGEGA